MQSAGVPAGWYGDPTTQGAVAPGAGYRAVAVSRWRRLTVALGVFSLMTAILFEIVATVMAIGIRTVTSSESSLFLWSWLYKPMDISFGNGTITHQMYVGYPPVLLGVALVAALMFIFWVAVRPDAALKKAGARSAAFWSSREDKEHWRAALGRLGGSRVSLFRSNYRVLLALAAIVSLVAVGLSAIAILNRGAVATTGQPVSNLSVGLGPWVCVVAVAIAAIVFVIAMLGHSRDLLVQADGRVLDRTS